MNIFLKVFLVCVCSAVVVRAETMSYLDNGQIRLGVDLTIGGAVTYLAESGTTNNMINSWDWGRQVQLSFYSGPVPFKPEGATLAKEWYGLGWNPIQAGDTYHNGSKVIEQHNDGKTIRVKCIPMIWPLKNVPAECTFECTYQLVGKTVEVATRMVVARSDQTQYQGRNQELPAVYANGPWYKLVSYLGNRPFAHEPTTTVVDLNDGKGWPWVSFYGPEHWAALVDKNDHGVGIFHAEAMRFSGGFAGKLKGSGGPKDNQTSYIAPNIEEILDHNITYNYQYVLVMGTVPEIRQYAYIHTPLKPPVWRFANDRQHWTFTHTTDTGWPIKGELCVKLDKPAQMRSPLTFWKAEEAGKLQMEAAFETAAKAINVQIELFDDSERRDWPCWGPDAKQPPKAMLGQVPVPIIGDNVYRTYTLNLTKIPNYRGAMIRLHVLLPKGRGTAHVKSVSLLP